tara:strand:+ start:9103 stop:9819 length:717 start_codon:yes stop_codon:yes gene_type:complete
MAHFLAYDAATDALELGCHTNDGIVRIGAGGSLRVAADLTVLGTTTLESGITNTAIGASSPSTGAFTTLSASTGLDSTIIGANTAADGTFTALTATGTTTIATVDLNGGAIDGTTIRATTPAAGTFTVTNVTSDRRLKENIQAHDRGQIHANVMRLEGVDYNLIADAGKEKNSGFIAQEVEEIFPQFVKENSNGIKSVNYSQMTSVLLSALQHQQTTIEMLETRILSLENHTSSITEL